MKRKQHTLSLVDLPDDMLAEVLGKVGESSHVDLRACIFSCKTFKRISSYPDVLKKLNLDHTFPPPWDRQPEKSELLYECARAGNLHAIFLCGLFDFYYRKETIVGSAQLLFAAQANHPEAMYLYGMILINDNKLQEGSKYIKKLWTEKGIGAVRECHLNCRPVVLELSVRQYREYDILLAEFEVPDACVLGEFDVVCEACIIYKEIYRFIDYMHHF